MTIQLNNRQIAILDQVRQQGRVTVEQLSETFVTTPQTIRRDLQVLADTGEVMRFHGGASLPVGTEYTGYEIRKAFAVEQKELIGQAVAKRIPANTVMMINAGTTTAAVAQAIKHHVGLKVISDNVSIANDLRHAPGIDVMVPGGTVRRSDGAILGGAAVDFIRQFRADIAVIGAAAVATDGSLLDFDLREANVARAIINHSRHVILAVDSSKFQASAPVCIGHLSQVHTLVTDICPLMEVHNLCEKHEVDLVEADGK